MRPQSAEEEVAGSPQTVRPRRPLPSKNIPLRSFSVELAALAAALAAFRVGLSSEWKLASKAVAVEPKSDSMSTASRGRSAVKSSSCSCTPPSKEPSLTVRCVACRHSACTRTRCEPKRSKSPAAWRLTAARNGSSSGAEDGASRPETCQPAGAAGALVAAGAA